MLELDHVTYSYPNTPQPVLHDLTLTIAEGEFVVVCGPSGSGKSTFLRLLNGLVPHFHGGRFAGDVRVWGRSTRSHEPRDLADLVGFVFQDPEAQFVVDVVEDEIVFAMENLGLPPRLMRRRVEEVLDQLGIAQLRRRRVSSLSGGEQQRVAIAAVLAAQPRALVLDEPTSQLDPHAAEEVLTALQKLNDDLGLTVILSEHRLERVVQYADRVIAFGTNDERRMTNDERDVLKGVSSIVYRPSSIITGAPRDVLAQIDTVPPLVQLGRALGWSPLPLTIKEGRRFVRVESGELGDKETRRQGDKETRSSFSSSSSSSSFSIAVEHVHFSYGDHEALYDVSMEARPGEVLALMGRNGSGKTTLLKLLTGLLKPQRGSVRVLGHDVARMAVEDVAAFVGYVPQDPHRLLFHDTLREELEFTLQTENQEPRTKNQSDTSAGSRFSVLGSQVESTLAQFGLTHLAATYPRDLSGGEAQRAALAAIFVGNPDVLLLDEPTRGLDYAAKGALGDQLRQLAGQGHAIIVSTHDVELVASCADRVVLLGDGEVVVEGPVQEVLSDSLIFSSQVAKLFPGTGWLTVTDVLRNKGIKERKERRN